MNKNQNTQISQKDLKQAYQIVTADLFNSIIKAKTNQSISIGTYGWIGSLNKTECKLKSALDKQTYVFYKFSFKASSKLKKELNKVLDLKWNKKRR